MKGRLILHRGGSPQLNLALEEALLEYVNSGRSECVVRIWINPPSVTIGYMLPECAEVNCKEARALDIPVVRRISGGGAVYHDWGNVNISVFLPKRLGVNSIYGFGTRIILRALSRLGLRGHVENDSDVVVDGMKVSGSAAAIKRRSTLFHATLLVNARIDVLNRVIRPRLDRVNEGRVTIAKYRPYNLSYLLNAGVSVNTAIKTLIDSVPLSLEPNALPEEVLQSAMQLYSEKYSTRRWSPLGPISLKEPESFEISELG